MAVYVDNHHQRWDQFLPEFLFALNSAIQRSLDYPQQNSSLARNFRQSSAQHKFSAKLAQKWKGPYLILKQLGPLNY